jgi:hypothetical protein
VLAGRRDRASSSISAPKTSITSPHQRLMLTPPDFTNRAASPRARSPSPKMTAPIVTNMRPIGMRRSIAAMPLMGVP